MTWPDADVSIDESLVRELVSSQFSHLSQLTLRQVGEGFDNSLWRLGDELVVRVPRREVAAALIENELRWLPVVARDVTLQTPLPLLAGAASERFAWPWLIATWIDGAPGDEVADVDEESTAVKLATFLRTLHVDAPSDAPRNPFRGVPLEERSDTVASRLPGVRHVVDVALVRDLWSKRLAAPVWSGPPQWLHGDLHPGNTLYREGQLVGVVDFGDLGAGDPATDLAGGLMCLPFDALATFFTEYDVDDSALLWRVVGWALQFGLFMTSLGLSARPSYLPVGRRALDNAQRLALSL
jgi:aminoglycoside phosphotransferase (APT) family kinase protein